MKQKLLYICDIILVPKAQISTETPDLEILNLAATIEPTEFVPGSANFSLDGKNPTAGDTYSNQLVWAIAGQISADNRKTIKNTGAVVVQFTTGETIVLHKNDGILQNADLRPLISSNTTRSQVVINITTNYILI